jgi:hypothetical protein
MLVVISPAKRLDWDMVEGVEQTPLLFPQDAARLSRTAARLSRAALQDLMDISPDLAKLNQQRFRDYAEIPEPDATRPAAWAFAGDTYQGLEMATLDADARRWADDHLRILSGLYGLLAPRDGIQPYRLEMGSRLKTRRGGSLYAWWQDRIAKALNTQAEAADSTLLVNRASQEYFGAVDRKALKLDVIAPVFMEEKPQGPKIVSFFAKRARGAMARFVMDHRITDADALRGFDTGGYKWDAERSTPQAPVFIRPAEAQKAA